MHMTKLNNNYKALNNNNNNKPSNNNNNNKALNNNTKRPLWILNYTPRENSAFTHSAETRMFFFPQITTSACCQQSAYTYPRASAHRAAIARKTRMNNRWTLEGIRASGEGEGVNSSGARGRTDGGPRIRIRRDNKALYYRRFAGASSLCGRATRKYSNA